MKKFTMPQIFPSLPNHLWNQPRGLGVLALLSSVFMFACGDAGTTENITNNYTSGMEIAEKVSDLPKCSADNAGEQYLVKADGEFYACNGKDWKALGGSGFAADYSCETKPLADDSGVAIYCGGDSIGVVLNGKDGLDGAKGERGKQGDKGETGEAGAAGADGKDGLDGKDGVDGKPGVGCKVTAQTESAVTIQCGDDKFNMNLNSGSGEVIEPVEEVVSLEKLNGVSQKGPFINGSTVTLFELDGSRSLVQTGRTFGGEIITDDGRFSVNNVSLKSSYVRLTANGFYRNEVSGKNSTSSIVLNAYSDLQARNSVNINLLTHLEYYRVGYLMENGLESTIKASKKRAQQEIFAAFGINNEGFGYSEDMDVFGEGDQNAALLAISILLQGDRSEADLSGLLASFSKDIEEDGKWDDKAIRGTIAKWALKKIVADSLNVFRKNVESWGLGEVPEFEKHISAFVENELGVNYFAECENGETVGLDDLAIVCKDSKWEKNYVLDERDGQLYKTVKIGNQTWMAENLNYDPGDVSAMGSYAWHGCYDNAKENCTTYGRLYTWEVAMNNAACAYGKTCSPSGVQQGICPEGWHLPTSGEFNTMRSVTGTKIRANSWLSNDDVFGFSLLPAGNRYYNGNFYYQGSGAYLWSSSEGTSNLAYFLYVDESGAYMYSSNEDYAFSVRCLKNSD